MIGNKKLIDILKLFPNSACDIKNLNAISNGKKNLLELADSTGLSEDRTLETYTQFIKKYSDLIDLKKYLLFQYFNYDTPELSKNQIDTAKDKIKELLLGEKNTTVYFLETRNELLEIDEHSISEVFGKKEKKKEIDEKYMDEVNPQ